MNTPTVPTSTVDNATLPETNISEILQHHDISVRGRARIEIAIVHELLRRLVAAGYTVKIDTEGDNADDAFDHDPSNPMPSLLRIFGLDECALEAYPVDALSRRAWIKLVLGNDGYDVICDYNTSLEQPVMAALNEWVTQMEDNGGVPPTPPASENRNERDLILNGYPPSIGIIGESSLPPDSEALTGAVALANNVLKHVGTGQAVYAEQAFGALAVLLDAVVNYVPCPGGEPTLIRVWIQNGLVSAVEGLPAGFTLRKIDLDAEGALDSDTELLEGDDVPPFYGQAEREECSGKVRGYIGEWEGGK